MILLIDNYDSFSYNLYQLIGGINPDIRVIRNDELTVSEIEELAPSHIILSPGPGKPGDAGVCEDVVRELGGKFPILGVCLGHQAICEVYGATVTYAKRLMHGKQSVCTIDESEKIFEGIGEISEAGADSSSGVGTAEAGVAGSGRKLAVARYHSLAAKEETIPDCLKVIATSDDDNEIMAVKHKTYPVYGLQFHPESILTPEGVTILKNFLAA
ncbi:MAG: aminodeoxychorismate/anthranilate synthase component II [Eubacterium sp.]|nr:aminodeoxychorismate/anthranilate synthase component II [Eubacterium sp.]